MQESGSAGACGVTTKTIGKRIPRIEDRDLIRGKARFVDDIHIEGLLHAVFVRSPHAHAEILAIGKDAALAFKTESQRKVIAERKSQFDKLKAARDRERPQSPTVVRNRAAHAGIWMGF